jgi:hypothetical protein
MGGLSLWVKKLSVVVVGDGDGGCTPAAACRPLLSLHNDEVPGALQRLRRRPLQSGVSQFLLSCCIILAALFILEIVEQQ